MPPGSRHAPVLHRALETLFPFPCLGCSAELPWRRDALGLCDRCRARLPRRRDPSCSGCGRPLPRGGGRRCGECLRRPPPWEDLSYPFRYEDPLPGIVHALKLRRLDFLALDLGRVLAREIGSEAAARCDVVVAVPMAWPRRLTRGFNQAEILARCVADAAEIPLVPALRRRLRRRQTRLGLRERSRNLRGSFSSRGDVTERSVLLVDDVFTTGATLRAAAGTLRRAGAITVRAAVVARTPRHGEARGTKRG